jgi:mitogen-activated protein kinase organizer 1
VVAWGDSVTSLTVAGHRISGGSVDGTVRTIDIRAGRMQTDDLGHPVLCVRKSHDDNCLLAGMLGGRLALLDRASGEVLAEYRGHVNDAAKVDSCLTYGDAHVVGLYKLESSQLEVT